MTTGVCATCGPVPAGEIRHLDHDSPHGHERHECGSRAGLDWTKTKEHDMTTTPLDLDAIRTLAEAADLQPLKLHKHFDDVQEIVISALATDTGVEARIYVEETADLILAVLNNLPSLLDELAKTRAELERAKALLAEYVDGEYPHRRAKQLLAANPATTAEPAATLPLLPDIAHMTTPLPDEDEPADEPKATTRQPICGDPHHRHSGCCDRWTPIGTKGLCGPGCPVHPKGLTPQAEPAAS